MCVLSQADYKFNIIFTVQPDKYLSLLFGEAPMTDSSTGRDLPIQENDNSPQIILAIVWGVVVSVSVGLIYMAAALFGYI
jgi:hypothetical protein